MKQRISAEQLKELTPEKQEKLREWWEPKDGDWYYDCDLECDHVVFSCESDHYHSQYPDNDCLPLLSIGQCIELLKGKTPKIGINWVDVSYDFELIDTLWQYIKEVL
jgi:hypothetical protein